ncbi:MAG: L-rhamnose mutarotase [Rhizobiales bacterium]|nr:L-rhamnose mutarotase [Hyphomicrobiales bacterium]
MQRMGMVIGIKPERIDDYKKLHLAVWPEILTQIQRNSRNTRFQTLSFYSVAPSRIPKPCISCISLYFLSIS